MAFQAGNYHYFAFYGVVNGLTVLDFTVLVFTVDGVTVDTATSDSLDVIGVGSGFYYAKYLPSKAGFYYLALSNVAHGIKVADAEDIEASEFVVNLTQDTGGTNALRPIAFKFLSAGGSIPGLDEYLLMIFQSDDWKVGRTQNSFAVAMTRLDIHGNWLTSPLVVSPGTYHVIIRNNFGVTRVIKSNLDVGDIP